MPTADHDLRREAIRRTLAYHAGGVRNAGAVAEATLGTWSQVAAQLALVLGTRGVEVLLRRSLHLASATFPWLAIVGEGRETTTALLANLKACLAEREATDAAEASHALLVTFTDLLADLIGDSLTGLLLDPVWKPPPPGLERETVP